MVKTVQTADGDSLTELEANTKRANW